MARRNLRRKISEDRKKTSLVSKAILVLLLGILLIEVFLTWNMTSTIKEKTRPANLEIVRIADNTCVECTTIGSLSSPIENNNASKVLSTKTLDISNPEAQSLIQQYGIQKIPAVVVTGEFRKNNIVFLWGQLNGRMLDKAVIIEAKPPYVNASSGNKEGLVSLITITDSACIDCPGMDTFVNSLKQAGVKFVSEKTIDFKTTEAQSWISTQDIKRIPAIVFSKDINAYDAVRQFLIQTNATQRQGYYAYHTSSPPFLNLTIGTVVGRISVIYLTDNSCTTCYNVTNHRAILQRFGLKVVNESTIDVSSTSGTQLIAQYNITKVPTILISPDSFYYTGLSQVWPTVGTIASDGWFIFRGTEQMGTYQDLSTGTVITPKQ